MGSEGAILAVGINGKSIRFPAYEVFVVTNIPIWMERVVIKTTNLLGLALLCIFSILLSACGGGGGGSPSDSGEPTVMFTIQAEASPGIGGSVSGTGSYKNNSTISLQAVPNAGYVFLEWQENGAFVSDQPILSVEVTEDKSFTALFSENVIKEIKLSPVDAEIPLYTHLTLSAQAVYTDGSYENVTNSVTWSSSDNTIAAFDTNLAGTLNSEAEGTVQILATMGTVSGATNVTVTSPELQSLTLSKSNFVLALGETDFVRAEGHYRGGVVVDVTDSVVWASANDAIVTVGNNANAGLLTSVAVGSTSLTASLDGSSVDATVTVNQVALVSLAIAAGNTNISEGALTQLTATATYTDSSSKDVTEQGVWESGDSTIATVSNLSPDKGLVSALSSGPVTITVKVGELTQPIALEVVEAPNEPGGLTLQAVPNVILTNGTDTSQIIATVVPNDGTNGVIADGRPVRFVKSSGSLILNTDPGNTVSGKVEKEASSSTAGLYEIIADVPETIALDQVTVKAVASFSEVVRTTGTANLIINGGNIQPGSMFTTTVTNTSNRPFNFDGIILFNGEAVISSTNDPNKLGGGVLEGGEQIIVTIPLTTVVQNNGFRIYFLFSDTPTTTDFLRALVF